LFYVERSVKNYGYRNINPPPGLDLIGAMDADAVITCETMAIIFYIVSARR
jgi:hypothetical protein